MNEIGNKAIYYIDLLNQNWNKLHQLNSNIPKALKLYGLFLFKIYDDPEKGEQMIRRFISIIKIKFKQNYQFNIFIKNFSIAKNKFPI